MDSANLTKTGISSDSGLLEASGGLIFVTGGARSGKSRFATERALGMAGSAGAAYLATGQAMDPEFAERIEAHKKERKGRFFTVEEALEPGAAFASLSLTYDVAVLDCVTTWLGNVFYHKGPADGALESSDIVEIERFAEAEIATLLSAFGPRHRDTPASTGTRPGETGAGGNGRHAALIVISNELGMGLVPADKTSRAYRDVHGRINQKLAAAANEVWFLVSGIPWRLK